VLLEHQVQLEHRDLLDSQGRKVHKVQQVPVGSKVQQVSRAHKDSQDLKDSKAQLEQVEPVVFPVTPDFLGILDSLEAMANQVQLAALG